MAARRDQKRNEKPLTEKEREELIRLGAEKFHYGHPDRARTWLRRQRAALLREVPKGFHVKGTSTLIDCKTGEPIVEWVKTSADKEDQLRALKETATALGRKIRLPKIKAPKKTRSDLLVAYPMGDPHFGMYAAAREAGEKFNLEIAERNLVSAVDHLVELAPDAETALIANLGDFAHADNGTSRTSRSGAVLDVAAKHWEVFQIGIAAMHRCVERALEKHRKVIVVIKMGNHDDQTSLAIATCLHWAYRTNPRVTVSIEPLAYHYFRFGRVLVGIAHGHNAKPDQLGQIMAADRPKDWGETEHRYWLCGHVHHDSLKEVPGCKVESFRTLAPRDAWATAAGYRSGRDMKCIVYDKAHGEILRHTVGVGMLA